MKSQPANCFEFTTIVSSMRIGHVFLISRLLSVLNISRMAARWSRDLLLIDASLPCPPHASQYGISIDRVYRVRRAGAAVGVEQV